MSSQIELPKNIPPKKVFWYFFQNTCIFKYNELLNNTSELVCFVLSLTVDDSAILDCQFSDFYHPLPQGYQKILFEQQIF